jgi:hypothetical protein
MDGDDRQYEARNSRTLGIIATGAGVALVGTAAYLLYRERRMKTTTIIAPTAEGVTVGLAGRF